MEEELGFLFLRCGIFPDLTDLLKCGRGGGHSDCLLSALRVWVVVYNRHWFLGNPSQESLLKDRLAEDQNLPSTSGGL
jgi:hypothetical protein